MRILGIEFGKQEGYSWDRDKWDEMDRRYMKGLGYVLGVWAVFSIIYLPFVL